MGEREVESCRARVGLAKAYVELKKNELEEAQENVKRCEVLLEKAEKERRDELWEQNLKEKKEV
ncbi:hypothetical protein KAW43_01435 [Candidatus Parcubacteria bacterium]|nr:hypothetical protein [Candidatus Parcubacteria bacterium]